MQQEFAGKPPGASNGVIKKFADDLERLTSSDAGMIAQSGIKRSLAVAAMEYYYYTPLGEISSLFTLDGNMLHARTSALAGFDVKSNRMFAEAVQAFLSPEEATGLTSALTSVDALHVQVGTGGALFTGRDNKNDAIVGGAGVDVLDGGAGRDVVLAGAGRDFLNGGNDNDILLGGLDVDTYVFSGTWGKDVIVDLDGQGFVQVDGKLIGEARLAGGTNNWAAKLEDGQIVGLATYEAADSTTGVKLVITRAGSTDNTVTITNFDFKQATGDGYLGIRLESRTKLVVVEGNGSNFFAGSDPDPTKLAGRNSNVTAGKTFTVHLNQAAEAGQMVRLIVEGAIAAGTKAVLGDRTVDANGATIELQPGQTQVSFALIGEAAGSGSFSVVLTGEGETVTSNTWGLSASPAASQPNVLNGDYTKLVASGRYTIDSTGNYVVDAANPVSVGAADVLTGSAQADRIVGLSGHDLLFGKDGSDRLEGGAGNDILHGGLGADTLEGGDGDDLIYGSSTGDFAYLTNANWSFWPLPYPLTTLTTGFGWRTYTDGSRDQDGFLQVALSSDVQRDKQDGDQSNTINAGAGDDTVAAGTGADHVKGGDGADDIYGMAGSDVLLGEAGDDRIYGDGPAPELGLQLVATATADQHRSDFIDGGAGNDILIGQGGSDVAYGGAGNDRMWGDDRSLVNTPASVHGEDYLNGEDGADTIVGGGKSDTIYGGADNDVLKGDDDADRLGGEYHGDDYIDGEGGNDTIYGGGRSDRLFGGAGDDRLLGDDKALGAGFDGDDSLDGKEGKDTLVGGGASDRLYGGDDADKLYGDGETRENADLELARHGDDYLDGGKGDDVLIGGGGSDTLMGGAGADDIEGDGNGSSGQYERSDWIDGGEGDDQLRGGGGADTVRGSEGADKLWGDAGDDALDGGAGNDLLYGGEGNERLEGGIEDDQLFGGQGNDSLSGGAGNDLLEGGAGNDIVAGGAGDDKLKAGEGSDALEGGEGNDTYLVAAGPGVTTIEAGSGTDLVTFEAPLALGTLSGSATDDEILLNLSTEQQVLVRGNANFLIGGQLINSAVLASILNTPGRSGAGAPQATPQSTTTNLYNSTGQVVGSLVRKSEAAGTVTTTTYLGPDGTGPRVSSQ